MKNKTLSNLAVVSSLLFAVGCGPSLTPKELLDQKVEDCKESADCKVDTNGHLYFRPVPSTTITKKLCGSTPGYGFGSAIVYNSNTGRVMENQGLRSLAVDCNRDYTGR